MVGHTLVHVCTAHLGTTELRWFPLWGLDEADVHTACVFSDTCHITRGTNRFLPVQDDLDKKVVVAPASLIQGTPGVSMLCTC